MFRTALRHALEVGLEAVSLPDGEKLRHGRLVRRVERRERGHLREELLGRDYLEDAERFLARDGERVVGVEAATGHVGGRPEDEVRLHSAQSGLRLGPFAHREVQMYAVELDGRVEIVHLQREPRERVKHTGRSAGQHKTVRRTGGGRQRFATSAGFIRRPPVLPDMPMKGSGDGAVNEVDRWDGGAGWIAYPDEEMQRASHAVVAPADDEDEPDAVYVVDPIDVPGLDEWLADLGEVAGVLVLLDRHKRDSAAVAQRHDVAVHIPSWMSGVASKLDAPVERLGDSVAGFDVQRLVDNPFWQEAALYHSEAKVLFTPESLGTVDYFCAPGERVGVHPALRLFPPKQLGKLDVERILVGHGEGVADGTNEAIRTALSGSRARAPKLYLKTLKGVLS